MRVRILSILVCGFLVCVGCNGQGPGARDGQATSPGASDAASEVLVQARALAADVPAFTDALAQSGIVRETDGLTGPGSADGLYSRVGDRATQGLQIGAGTSLAARVHVGLVGASASEAEVIDHAVVYRDVHPSTDAIVVARGGRVEVFYVLRGPDAPREWRWQLGESPELHAEAANGTVELRDSTDQARIRISAPGAVDAAGQQLAMTTTFAAGQARFALSGAPETVQYPVLVDPVIEMVDWVRAAADPNPVGRHSQALAYDAARSRLVLFGGQNAGGNLGDTWEWDGTTWTERTPATSPPARVGPAMAYDAARSRVVLFGGIGATGYLGDTWEWDGTTWTQRAPATSPPARVRQAMAYDAAQSRVVLFGGRDASGVSLGDTWEWDGTTWTQRTPATSPPARSQHGLAYDAARSRVVLFGGRDASGVSLGDTWEWDGTTWTQRTPATSPPARSLHALAYDSAGSRVVLFGGRDASGGYLGDTWEWDGTTWTQRTPATSPAARGYHALAYDL